MNGIFEGLMNQSYHLDSESGYSNYNSKMGPAEREEMYRCEMIDVRCEQQERLERKNPLRDYA